jgi:beta-lactam-binding protein with PASTA domain
LWSTKKEEFKIKILKYFLIFIIGISFGSLAFLGVIYSSEKVNIVYLPNIIGYEIEDAKKIIEDLGLKVETFGEGKVINSIPNVSNVVKKGRIVRLFGESFEKGEYIIPNFFGVSYHTVIEILENWGLKVEVNKIKYPGPDGRVLATYPNAGEKIKTGEFIKVLVDNGELGGNR